MKEDRDGLHMGRVRKQIERVDPFERVAGVHEPARVARQRRDVA
jgi:hypothetical protein